MRTRVMHTRLRSLASVAALTVFAAAACGVSDRKVQVESGDSGSGGEGTSGAGDTGKGGGSGKAGNAGNAGSAGKGGSGGSSGEGPSGDAGSSSGTAGQAEGGSGGGAECDPACTGETPFCEQGVCVACRAGTAPRCGAGETPEVCDDGTWVPQEPCGGNTPVCGNGTCSAVRFSGGLVSVGATSATGSIRLVDHGFEGFPTLCGTVSGAAVCLTGGIRP